MTVDELEEIPVLTALGVAARKGHADVAQVLIHGGADINGGAGNRRPLEEAVRGGDAATRRL